MTIIAGVTVVWDVSPRIIVIPDPVVEVTVEDLQDTLLNIEDTEAGVVFPYLRKTSGGENLGGGTSVGWTMELQNAQVYFEARSTPLLTGLTCDTADTAGEYFSAGAQDYSGVAVGDTVFNGTDGSMATIIDIDDTNDIIRTLPLTGGLNNDWEIGDLAVIYHNESCSISGGNVVAVDSVGAEINPVLQSPNVQVVRTSASSATQTSQAQLEAITFIGSKGLGISLAPTTGTDSSTYPYGNTENPCKTEANIEAIHTERPFRNVYVRENLTITQDHSTERYTWIADSPSTVAIALDAGSDVTANSFEFAYLSGKFSPSIIVERCVVGGITNAQNYIYESALIGPITVGGDLTFSTCFPSPSQEVVTIDFDNLAKTVKSTSNNGVKWLVQNMVTGSEFHIEGPGGKVTFDASCAGGTVKMYGGIEVVNNGTFDEYDDDTTFTKLKYQDKILKNKREVKKTGSVWQIIVYDDDGVTPILTKDLKDYAGADITDLPAGVMAIEEATSV